MMKTHKSIMTPWGYSQSSTKLGFEGIICYTTAGHGGFFVPNTLNQQVPEPFRAQDVWYEEDSDWSAVAITFPDLFTEQDYKTAIKNLKSFQPDAYEQWSGVTLAKGESIEKDRRLFSEQHADDLCIVKSQNLDENIVEILACKVCDLQNRDAKINTYHVPAKVAARIEAPQQFHLLLPNFIEPYRAD